MSQQSESAAAAAHYTLEEPGEEAAAYRALLHNDGFEAGAALEPVPLAAGEPASASDIAAAVLHCKVETDELQQDLAAVLGNLKAALDASFSAFAQGVHEHVGGLQLGASAALFNAHDSAMQLAVMQQNIVHLLENIGAG